MSQHAWILVMTFYPKRVCLSHFFYHHHHHHHASLLTRCLIFYIFYISLSLTNQRDLWLTWEQCRVGNKDECLTRKLYWLDDTIGARRVGQNGNIDSPDSWLGGDSGFSKNGHFPLTRICRNNNYSWLRQYKLAILSFLSLLLPSIP